MTWASVIVMGVVLSIPQNTYIANVETRNTMNLQAMLTMGCYNMSHKISKLHTNFVCKLKSMNQKL